MHESKNVTASQSPAVWLERFLHRFREIYANLDENDLEKRRFGLIDFRRLAEIHWIRITEPDIHLFLVRPQNKLHEDELYIYDPFKFADAGSALEEILSTASFARELATVEADRFAGLDKNATFRDVAEIFLLNVVNHPPSIAAIGRSQRNPSSESRMTLGGSSFGWIILGDLLSVSPQHFAEEVFPTRQAQATSSGKSEEEEVRGFGAHVYPPLWIGDLGGEVFGDKTAMGMRRRSNEIALRAQYKGHSLLGRRDGLIAFHAAEDTLVYRWLNQLMAAFLLEAVPAHIVQPDEIYTIRFNESGDQIRGVTGAAVSPRTRLIGSYHSTLRPFYEPATVLPLAKLEGILVLGETIAERVSEDALLLFLSAYTHYDHRNYAEAFLMAWIALEKRISAMWGRHIDALSSRRRAKFKGGDYWTTDHSLELLNLIDEIGIDYYKTLMQFKRLRNKVVHENVPVSEDDAAKIVDYVENLLRDDLQL